MPLVLCVMDINIPLSISIQCIPDLSTQDAPPTPPLPLPTTHPVSLLLSTRIHNCYSHTYTHNAPILPYTHTAIHPYCHTLILPYTHTAILPYCHTPILPYTHTAIHPYCHTPILPYTHTAIHLYCHTPILPYTYTAIHPYCHTPILPYTHTAIHPRSLSLSRIRHGQRWCWVARDCARSKIFDTSAGLYVATCVEGTAVDN
jgi:hypothetical protein